MRRIERAEVVGAADGEGDIPKEDRHGIRLGRAVGN